MRLQQISDLAFTILVILAVIPGLWMGRKLVPWVVVSIRNEAIHRWVSSGPGAVILWLALGSFFLGPLVDLIEELRLLVNLFIPGFGPITSFWGSTSSATYALISVALFVAVYGLVLWFSRAFWQTDRTPGRGLRLFCWLAVASLILALVQSVSFRVLSLPVPG